ncbi:hypothetical protein PTKIN_Ptkin10aG0037400 [Pterospermum kingtungense]
MDEIRETASAYYANLEQSQKQKAHEFFRSLDKNGDGKINLQEYIAALNKQRKTWLSNSSFFKELDEDGNGSLDFNEVLMLFYIIESGRLVFCDGCGAFLKGHHDENAIFLDNYVLSRHKWRQQTSQSQPSPSQKLPKPPMQESQSQPSPTHEPSMPKWRKTLSDTMKVVQAGAALSSLYRFGETLVNSL